MIRSFKQCIEELVQNMSLPFPPTREEFIREYAPNDYKLTLALTPYDVTEENLCGPALTDHDWTMHGGSYGGWVVAIGCDVEEMNRLFLLDPNAFAECNWCACSYAREKVDNDVVPK